MSLENLLLKKREEMRNNETWLKEVLETVAAHLGASSMHFHLECNGSGHCCALKLNAALSQSRVGLKPAKDSLVDKCCRGKSVFSSPKTDEELT